MASVVQKLRSSETDQSKIKVILKTELITSRCVISGKSSSFHLFTVQQYLVACWVVKNCRSVLPHYCQGPAGTTRPHCHCAASSGTSHHPVQGPGPHYSPPGLPDSSFPEPCLSMHPSKPGPPWLHVPAWPQLSSIPRQVADEGCVTPAALILLGQWDGPWLIGSAHTAPMKGCCHS